MNREEFHVVEWVNQVQPKVLADVIGMLGNYEDRTLLYGYNTDHDTWHIYIQNQEVVKHIYNREKTLFVAKGRVHLLTTLVPNKRVYPETCDVGFCYLLIRHNIHVPFTTFNDDREPQKYYGEIFNA